MIGITVNGIPLYLPTDTAITLQQSASWANIDDLSSDIVWTFTVPAAPNAAAFAHSHYLIVSDHRGYPCTVTFQAVPIANGTLYVQQSSDERSLSCGIVMNNFAPGWGEKKLSEDDLGPDIPIATAADTYQAEWLTFLRSTLSPDSLVKFMIFIDQNFMDDNDAFGYYHNELSHLQSSLIESLMAKWVNRLTFDSDGNIINSPASDLIGTRIFNDEEGQPLGAKVNGYHFAPALLLPELVKRVFSSVGFSVMGSFISDPRMAKLFVQSLRAMDGNILQYPLIQRIYINTPGVTMRTDQPSVLSNTIPFKVAPGQAPYTSFSFDLDSSLESVDVEFKLMLPVGSLQSGELADQQYDHYDEVYFLAFRSDYSQSFPRYRALIQNPNSSRWAYGTTGSAAYMESRYGANIWSNGLALFPGSDRAAADAEEILLRQPGSFGFVQLTNTVRQSVPYHPTDGEYYQGSATILKRDFVGVSSSEVFFPQLIRARVKTYVGDFPRSLQLQTSDGRTFPTRIPAGYDGFSVIEEIVDWQVVDFSDKYFVEGALNVFSSSLKWADHVPSLSHSDFIKALCHFFGLNFYFNSFSKQVQLSFFSGIYDAKSLDITPYVTSFSKQNAETPHYSLAVRTARNSQSINTDVVLPPVLIRSQLPPASARKSKYCYVLSEAVYYKSVSDSATDPWYWEVSHGSDAKLELGDSDHKSESVQADILVPNMRTTDHAHTPKCVEEIDQPGCSAMFQDSFTGEFPMVLRQYRGHRLLQLQQSGSIRECYIEDGNPTIYNTDGSVHPTAISLSATGERSVGELWQRPLYDFLAAKQDVQFTLRIPFSFFLRLYAILQPQPGSDAQQTRWVSYRSQRYLPSLISYQFSASDSIIVTLTCHRL